MLIDFNQIQTPAQLQKLFKKFSKNWQQKILHFANTILHNDVKINIQTSGSTGLPKKLVFTKNQLMASAKLTGEYFKFSSKKTILLCLSPDHIAGKMMIARAIYWKMKLLCTKQTANSLADLWQNLYFTSLVPYQLEHILNTNPNKLRLIDNILVGGSPIHYNLFNKLKKISTNFYESFGMTETLSHIAIKKLNGENVEKYFTTLPSINIQIDKNDCLITEVPYLNNPIHTNDIVQIIKKNKFNWLGRKDNLINSGSIKLLPELLEEKIKHLLDIPYFFTSSPDKLLGEKLVLVIEDKGDKIDEAVLFHQLKSHLPKYEVPKQIIKLKKICRTKNGKTKREKTRMKINF